MQKLVQKQKKATRAELERDQRKKAQAKLRALRANIREAKQRKRVRLKEVTSNCREAQRVISARAKSARARLSASIQRTRAKARTVCDVTRTDVRRAALAVIGEAIRDLETERAEQHQLRAWTRPQEKKSDARTSARRARELQQESDDEVRNNLEDPGLLIVWEAVKHKIKARGRTSRTEAFAEWLAEHPGEAYEIQEADAVRALEELERQERQLAKALGRRRYVEPEGLAAVPF
jgi:hypothetical protein